MLVGLAEARDESPSREDRQLAAEYLLSAYQPHDSPDMLERFERAGYHRILRAAYRAERRWASLASVCLRDPELRDDIFHAGKEYRDTLGYKGVKRHSLEHEVSCLLAGNFFGVGKGAKAMMDIKERLRHWLVKSLNLMKLRDALGIGAVGLLLGQRWDTM